MADRRLPKGAEAQCAVDDDVHEPGLIFSSNSAFDRHFVKRGKQFGVHVHPSEVGLVLQQRKDGVVWGWPGSDYEPGS